MAIRCRRDGRLVCATMSDPENGDIYIDDDLHYELSVGLCLIEADPNHKENGLWYWSFPKFRVEDE